MADETVRPSVGLRVTDADRTKARVVTRWWADDTSEVQMQEDIAAAIAAARTPNADVKAAVAHVMACKYAPISAHVALAFKCADCAKARVTLVAAGLLEAAQEVARGSSGS